VALAERDGRDPKIVFDLASKWIGPGPHLVYLEAWEFYYPGRQLGWHMYNPFGLDKEHGAKILARVDYAIVRAKAVEDLDSKLRGNGWRVQATFSPASRAVMAARAGRGLGAVPYGPYLLLHRQVIASPATRGRRSRRVVARVPCDAIELKSERSFVKQRSTPNACARGRI